MLNRVGGEKSSFSEGSLSEVDPVRRVQGAVRAGERKAQAAFLGRVNWLQE